MEKTTSRISAVLALLMLLFALFGCTGAGVTSANSPSPASKAATLTASATGNSSAAATMSSGTRDGTANDGGAGGVSAQGAASDLTVVENGEYSDKDSVALYIHTFGHLPSNYISKTKARKAGWVNTEGNLWDVLPGMSIGGSEYYNDDRKLPDARGRRWTECDIDYNGGFRGSKRIVFSNDGLVYYTGDHYETFERLY